MVRLGTPDNLSDFYCVDDGWLITELHRLGCQPAWKDEEAVYFKKNSKLNRALKKLDVVFDD